MTSVPSPNIMSHLAQINGRLQTFLTSAPGETGQSGNLVLGTLTASRRNSKPFIIGFIPPDVPVNYIPIKKTGQSVLDIPGFKSGPGAPKIGNIDSNKYLPFPPKLKQKRVRRPVSQAELRQGLIDAYVRITGVLPSPGVLRNMWAQKALENGLYGNKKVGTWNYNLGSSHAGGLAGSYNKDADGNRQPGNGIEKEVKEPSTGTWYISDDHHALKPGQKTVAQGGKGPDSYPVAFHSFDNLADASSYAVALLSDSYPGTLTAETPEAYNNALLPSRGIGQPRVVGHDYHVGGDGYQRSLEIQGRLYNANGFNDLPIESEFAKAIVDVGNVQEVKRELIAEGGFTGIEKDPKGDRLGRNIAVDESRLKTAKLQTDALIEQIRLIAETPPLIMLINPSNFDRSYENTADSSPKTRHGHVVHTWLERPMKISCGGITAGQYVFDVEGAGGLTGQNRIHSLSYGNLLSLVSIYKNNGIVFSGPEVGDEIGIPIVPFTIYMYYDNHVYLGSFDDFTVSDTADQPFQMSYSFNFTVRYDQHLNAALADLDIATNVFS